MQDDETENKQSSENKPSELEEDVVLDYELAILRKMRVAFRSTLHMLEAARDDLVEMGQRMDRLKESSERCRTAILKKRQHEQSQETP